MYQSGDCLSKESRYSLRHHIFIDVLYGKLGCDGNVLILSFPVCAHYAPKKLRFDPVLICFYTGMSIYCTYIYFVNISCREPRNRRFVLYPRVYVLLGSPASSRRPAIIRCNVYKHHLSVIDSLFFIFYLHSVVSYNSTLVH